MIKKITLFLSVMLLSLCLSKTSYSQSCGNAPTPCPKGAVNCSCTGASPTPCQQGKFYITMSEYIQENVNACWFCDVFYDDDAAADAIAGAAAGGEAAKYGGGLFGAINQLSTTIYKDLAKWFGAFMGMGILFFLLFKVGKMVVSLQEVDLMQFLNDLLKPLGRGIIAAALLGLTMSNVSFEIFHSLTNPIFMAAADMGNKIMDTAIGGVEFLKPGGVGSGAQDNSMNHFRGTDGQEVSWSFVKETCGRDAATALSATNESETALSKAQGKVLRCWMQQVSSSFITGIAVGGTLVRVSMKDFFDGFPMFLVGGIMWLGFWALYLMFPFRVLDAFIKFAFVMTLMPLWIVLWVFPATRQYTKKAWEMFLSACLLLMILALMISLTLMLVQNAIPTDARNGLLTCLRAGIDQSALSWISFGSGAILNTIAFTAMGWALLKEATPLANSFIGGGGSITTNVGNSVAETAGRVGALGWSATKAGAKAGRWTVGKTAGGIATGIDKGLTWAETPDAGKRASKVNRFFEAIHHPKNPFRSTPPLYDRSTLGTDSAKLTSAAFSAIHSGVKADEAKINRLARTGFAGDQKSLQDMKNLAKTSTEKAILENMMRSAEHNNRIDPSDLRALRDERARQAMAEHPLTEQTQFDKMNRDKADKQAEIDTNRAAFDRAKRRFEPQVNADLSRYEAAAVLTDENTYRTQRDSLCRTEEQKAVMDQLHLSARNNGGVIDSAARTDFIEHMTEARAAETLPDTASYERSDKAAVAWTARTGSAAATENLQNDMAYVERALASASDRTQFDAMIEAGAFSAGNETRMKTFSGQLWDARINGEGDVNRQIKSFISAYLQSNGESRDNANVLAEQVSNTSKAGVMMRDDTAISSSIGTMRKP